jgi:urease accessory protein
MDLGKVSQVGKNVKGAGIVAAISALGVLSAGAPALAHHMMGGETPSNFFEGFLSGLAHPIIGVDHFAFVVAIGLIAAGRAGGVFIPAIFVVAAMVGTGIHLLSVNVPAVEIAIALSVIAGGLLLVLKPQPAIQTPVLAILASPAGLFHGYAYGESIVGAEMTPLVAYLAGFTAIQFGIAVAALYAGNLLKSKGVQPEFLKRFAGGAICAIGGVFLSLSVAG